LVYSRTRAPTKTQREEKKYGRHCLKKKVPQGSFAYSRIRAEPNKNTALLLKRKQREPSRTAFRICPSQKRLAATLEGVVTRASSKRWVAYSG
jgi:hypothetical protein